MAMRALRDIIKIEKACGFDEAFRLADFGIAFVLHAALSEKSFCFLPHNVMNGILAFFLSALCTFLLVFLPAEIVLVFCRRKEDISSRVNKI